MTRCPLTYEVLPPGHTGRYSREGLRRLARALVRLEDLPYTAEEQRREAMSLATKMSIQGVQPKLSARLRVGAGRFEIVDRRGQFILKPQNLLYPHLPENEDLTMRLAATVGIEVPIHGLLHSADGSLTYFVKRFDRSGRGDKLALEDFAQLAGRTRETKYDSSMEKVAGILDSYATFPLVEKLELFRRTLFCFLCGNEDMHLKNFSLHVRGQRVQLSPAYDLLNTTIAMGGAAEELALPLCGKKRKLQRGDFLDAFARGRLGLEVRAIDDLLAKFSSKIPSWHDAIATSFLPEGQRAAYDALVDERRGRLGL